jgi:hypothetical protein
MEMAHGLPILWWMDAAELETVAEDSGKLKQIKERIELFETTSTDFMQLKIDIANIIKGS